MRIPTARRRAFGLTALLWAAPLLWVVPMLCAVPPLAAQAASGVFTSATTVSCGVAAPGVPARLGADEQLDLGGSARFGSLRFSALISTSVSAGLGAAARWASYNESQTLRWSWPGWSAASSGGGSGSGGSVAAPDLLAALEVKELAAALSGEIAGLGVGFKAELGKFPLKWGVGKAFRPSDIFRTMDYSALIPQAGGTPAARVSAYPSALSRVEAVAAIDGQGAIAAGARYLSSLGDFGAFAASAGWRRASSGSDEFSASLEGQLDVGSFSSYAEISARHSASTTCLYTMLGSGVALGSLTLYAEGQGAVGLSTSDLRLFSLATWALSDLTSISIPLFWFNDARTLSGGMLAQLEGLLGGRLSLTATGALFCASSPPTAVWSLGASWARSLSTY